MAAASNAQLTPEEYLVQERNAAFRSEYLQGQVTAMTGEAYEHSLIITNIVSELCQALRKSTCTVSSSDVRLAIASARLYTYPDIMSSAATRPLSTAGATPYRIQS